MRLKLLLSILGALVVWCAVPDRADARGRSAPNAKQAEARLRKAWTQLYPKETVAKVESLGPGEISLEVRDGAKVTTARYTFRVIAKQPTQSHMFEVALKLVHTDAGWVYDSLQQLADSDMANPGQEPPTRPAVKALILAELNKSQPHGFNLFKYPVPAKFDKVLVTDPTFKIFRDSDTWGFEYAADYETVGTDGQRYNCMTLDVYIDKKNASDPWRVRIDSSPDTRCGNGEIRP
jgi:hypothetical protein